MALDAPDAPDARRKESTAPLKSRKRVSLAAPGSVSLRTSAGSAPQPTATTLAAEPAPLSGEPPSEAKHLARSASSNNVLQSILRQPSMSTNSLALSRHGSNASAGNGRR